MLALLFEGVLVDKKGDAPHSVAHPEGGAGEARQAE